MTVRHDVAVVLVVAVAGGVGPLHLLSENSEMSHPTTVLLVSSYAHG